MKDTRLPVSDDNPILVELRQVAADLKRVEARQATVERELAGLLTTPVRVETVGPWTNYPPSTT